jgi:hypothetical protein
MGDLAKVGAGHSCSTQENSQVPGTNVSVIISTLSKLFVP